MAEERNVALEQKTALVGVAKDQICSFLQSEYTKKMIAGKTVEVSNLDGTVRQATFALTDAKVAEIASKLAVSDATGTDKILVTSENGDMFHCSKEEYKKIETAVLIAKGEVDEWVNSRASQINTLCEQIILDTDSAFSKLFNLIS